MIVRPYEKKDREEIARLHEARGDGTWLQEPDSPLAGPKVVAEVGGRIVGAAVGRRTLEAFLTLDMSLSPIKKSRIVMALLTAGGKQAREMGYAELHAPIARQVMDAEPRFTEFLMTIPGFNRDDRAWFWYDLNQKD